MPKQDANRKKPAASNGDWCTTVATAIALLTTQLQKVVDQYLKTTAHERKSLYHVLCDFSNIFAWEGAKHGQTKVVIHKAGTGPARLIWLSPRRIPPPLYDKVQQMIADMLRDRVIMPLKSL